MHAGTHICRAGIKPRRKALRSQGTGNYFWSGGKNSTLFRLQGNKTGRDRHRAKNSSSLQLCGTPPGTPWHSPPSTEKGQAEMVVGSPSLTHLECRRVVSPQMLLLKGSWDHRNALPLSTLRQTQAILLRATSQSSH